MDKEDTRPPITRSPAKHQRMGYDLGVAQHVARGLKQLL